MMRDNMRFSVINIKNDYDLIDDVIALGDSQKQTLGFLPAQAFYDYADKNSILVAVTKEREVLGYALFAHNQRHVCRLAHVCVRPKWRKLGVGNALVSKLKALSTYVNRIVVTCRRDYNIDRFWESNEFVAKGERAGRGFGDTVLTLWEYQQRPSLLSLPPEDVKPLAILDLNIIIAVTSEDRQDCESIFSFTYSDEIDFRVSEHSYTEANRNDDKTSRRMTRMYLNSLPRVDNCRDETVVSEVLGVIGCSKQDDAKQLASAVYNNADYFITKDAGLISHFKRIQQKFGLSVYTPTEFIVNYCNESGRDVYFPAYLSSTEISFRPVKNFSINALFYTYKSPSEKRCVFENCLNIASKSIENQSMFCIFVRDKEVGVCAQSVVGDRLVVRMLRLKKSVKHMKTLSSHIVENILYTSIKNNVNTIVVKDKFSGEIVNKALLDTGFLRDKDGLFKYVGRGFVAVSEALSIINKGKCADCVTSGANLQELEDMLWPAKVIENQAPVFIVPIKPVWASKLLSSRGHQLSLLESSDIILQAKRVYYRSSRGVAIQSPGRIVWYISGDGKNNLKKCVIGISLIEQVDVGAANVLFKKYERFGVYAWGDIMKVVRGNALGQLMAITFSKTEIFQRIVALDVVKSVVAAGEFKQFNPVAPFRISAKTFREIYELGTLHVC